MVPHVVGARSRSLNRSKTRTAATAGGVGSEQRKKKKTGELGEEQNKGGIKQ